MMSLGALGVVYGDIGTSPLYALRESFEGHGLEVAQENILGVLSLVFWSLLIVISIKYLTVVMRADNEGEGGILALTALIIREIPWPEGCIVVPIHRGNDLLVASGDQELQPGDALTVFGDETARRRLRQRLRGRS